MSAYILNVFWGPSPQKQHLGDVQHVQRPILHLRGGSSKMYLTFWYGPPLKSSLIKGAVTLYTDIYRLLAVFESMNFPIISTHLLSHLSIVDNCSALSRGVAVFSCALGSSKGVQCRVKARTGLERESAERAQGLALSNIHRNIQSHRLQRLRYRIWTDLQYICFVRFFLHNFYA